MQEPPESGPADDNGASDGSQRTRKSRLSPERRAELIAEAERLAELLRSDPAALREEIEEGVYLDGALWEPVIDN